MTANPLEEHFPLPRVAIAHGRFETLERAATHKRVLHVGCADAGLAEQRLATDGLLHLRLGQVARNLVGVDIDSRSVDMLRDAGVRQLHVADVTQPGWSSEFDQVEFDLIVISEVLEHVSNAGAFLENLAEFARSKRASAVFTVPSPFSPRVLRALSRNVEFVHPDHNCWFSFRTAQVLLGKHGWTVNSTQPYSFDDTRVRTSIVRAARGRRSRLARLKWTLGAIREVPYLLLVRWLQRRSPFFADGLILSCDPID